LESFINRFRIRSLKTQIDEARQRCNALAIEFDAAKTSAEKTEIARHYDKALKEAHALQLVLEMIERQQRESREHAKT
jgi:hypothetical protein